MTTKTKRSVKPDIDDVNLYASNLQQRLEELEKESGTYLEVAGLSKRLARQLSLEERAMVRLGLPLTSIHLDEHEKLLNEVTMLEFNWKMKHISDDVYLKSLNYKIEFHSHYFDQAQLNMLQEKDQDDTEG